MNYDCRFGLLDENTLKELMILHELELSILTQGKIKPDEDGYFVSKEDEERVKGLGELQDKYTYGWYIATEDFYEQIESINKFKLYIIEFNSRTYMDREKLYVHWDVIRFVKKEQIDNDCLTVFTSHGNESFDLMIYLYKESDEFIVHIHHADDISKFDTFSFKDGDEALEFLETLSYKHPEYKKRPYIKMRNIERREKTKNNGELGSN